MTIEAYAINVAAKLEDGVSPGLLRIIDSLTRANELMLDFAANVRNISRAGLSIGRNMEKAAAGANALGGAASGLTRASYVLDTMAASSADVVRNLRAANAESLGMGRIPGGGGAVPPSVAGGAPGSSGGSRYARNVGTAVGVTTLWGLYENARLQDTNIMSAATSQLPLPMWVKSADEMRAQEFAYARQYAFATGGKIEPFAEAMLEASRLLRTLPGEQQKALTSAAMPFAAVEAKLKGIPLPDALRDFIELAHMSGAYSPKAATPLFEAMMQSSLTTHMSLTEITRAASYALPSIHAAGANSSDVLLLLATMMQAGILNTKSGTWLNNLVLNALPNTLGSGLFKNKKQNEALHLLGLYHGNKSMFYRNGQADPMLEIALLAQAREHMSAEKFNAALKLAFGVQGMRAAAIFSEPQVLQNIHALSSLANTAQAPVDIAQSIRTLSAVGQADQTIANANMTIMNMSSTAMGPANFLLGKTSSFFDWTADFTKRHPVLGGGMDLGIIAGTLGAVGLTWKGGGIAVEKLGKVLPGLARGIVGLATTVMTNPYVLTILGSGAAGYAGGSWLGGKIDSGIARGSNYTRSSMRDWLSHSALGRVTGWFGYGNNEALHFQQAPSVHVQVKLDGREIAHHLVGPNNDHGTSQLNPLQGKLRPGTPGAGL